jgi:hypothetical protein
MKRKIVNDEKPEQKKIKTSVQEPPPQTRSLKDIFVTWCNTCDPRILYNPTDRPSCYGWGRQKIGEYIINSLKSIDELYEDEKDLENDKNLFGDICPLPIAHTIAEYWQHSPGVCYGSYETELLFFVLDFHIKSNGIRRDSILIRLMELAEFYRTGKVKYLSYYNLKAIPYYAKNLLATMSYDNLKLLKLRDGFYELITEDIKSEYGFADIVACNIITEEDHKDSRPYSLYLACTFAMESVIENYTKVIDARLKNKNGNGRVKNVSIKLNILPKKEEIVYYYVTNANRYMI